MLADHFVLAIVKFGLGRFEGPAKLAVGGSLAGVDLRSSRVRVQDNFFARWYLDRVRNVGRRLFHRSIFALGRYE